MAPQRATKARITMLKKINMNTLECIVNFRNMRGEIVLIFSQEISRLNLNDVNKNSYIEDIASRFGDQIRSIWNGLHMQTEIFSKYYKIILGLNYSIDILKKTESDQSIEHVISKELKRYDLMDNTSITLNFTLLKSSNEHFVNLSTLNNRDEVLSIIKDYKFLFKFLRKDLQRDAKIILSALENPTNPLFKIDYTEIFSCIPKYLLEDKEFVLSAAQRNGNILRYVKEEYKTDKEIILTAMHDTHFGNTFVYESKDTLNDKNFLLELARSPSYAFIKFAPK